MSDSNRSKAENSHAEKCIICGEFSSPFEVHPPKDKQSWAVLYNAAVIRNFEPIKILHDLPDELLSNVKFHRDCRCKFTNIKDLKRFDTNSPPSSSPALLSSSPELLETPCSSTQPQKRLKRSTLDKGTTYVKQCIFCLKKSKYKKSSKSRETLTQVLELRTDKKLRELAIERGDTRIIAITSRDIVAAEASYHKSCYLAYTRSRPSKSRTVDEYSAAEKSAYTKLFNFIREDLFSNPRVESQSYLLLKLIEYLKDEVNEIKDSTKKNFRYSLSKEFGSSLRFNTIEGKVYITPGNLSFDLLLSDYIKTKIKLESHLSAQKENDPIPEAAKKIKSDVKSIEKPQAWPPRPHELHTEYVDIPISLRKFLQNLFGESSAELSVVAWSIAQDIIYAIFKGSILTPKHVLLPMTAKSLTGNIQLLSILNRLGHGCSYSKLLEIDTAQCMEKLTNLSEREIPLPNSIHVSIPSVLAYDNIDRIEETLSGAGTSHRVNGIIVQKTSATCLPPRLETATQSKQRSISLPVPDIPDFIVGQRKNPPAIVTADLPEECVEHFKDSQRKNLFWVISRLLDAENQSIASWTGFNILIRNDVSVEPDTVAYLPCINRPATEMSTVHEILRQCIQIKTQLHLEKIVLVLDQAIFAKAVEIVWCHRQVFSDVFIMMGGFHTICNLLSIIGKLFGDAGLGDLAVEMGAVSKGSLRNVLQGKHYNRGIRLHKYIYEALMRIIYQQFEEYLESKFPEIFAEMEALKDLTYQFRDNMCNDTFKSAMENPVLKQIMGRFEDYVHLLKNKNGPLSSFWMTYLDLVELLLGLIRSNREGNWLLFIACIEEMIPWCFALDKINYARYLSINFAEISNLENTNPDISQHMKEGGFCVQLGSRNPFSRIPVDQTLEETVNRDTQTSGGTKGFSLKAGAVQKYYITAEYRASALRQLREFLKINNKFHHPDLHVPRIKIDEGCVSTAVQLLDNEWTNPFDANPSDIINLSTGRAVTSDIQTSLLTVRQRGETAYDEFKKCRLEKGEGFFEPIKKIKIKTFTPTATLKQCGKNKDVIIKADRKLFASMILIAESRHLNMQEVFSHPLGPLPWSLANPDGSMRKTVKAVLGKYLEDLVSPEETYISSSATVIDGMGLIQKLHGENKTFDELSDTILNAILSASCTSDRIDVVFDSYKNKSIKSAERISRGSEEGISFKNIKGGHRIIKWRNLLQSGDSKNKLIKFLVENWQEENKRKKLGNKMLYVTYGEKCFKLTDSTVQEIENLASSHEEADTRMMLHIKDAALTHPRIVCISDDTDVLVLALYISSEIIQSCNLYIKRGTSSRMRLININKLAFAIASDIKLALPGIHAWTGCDTVSAFSGQGKLKALKLLKTTEEFVSLFSVLGRQFTLSKKDHATIQKFTCQLYSRKASTEKINELRYQIFRSRQGQVDSAQLPPCEDCLHQHSVRANYQAAIWRRCLENFPEIPEPEYHGWMLDEENMLSIKWMTGAPAPDAVLELLSCSCAKSCQLPSCTCKINNLKCTSACKLIDCENMSEPEEEDCCLYEPCESDDEDDF